MFLDLIRAFCAAVVVVVLPGYFWAAVLCPTRGIAERLAYSSALSMASVPVAAITLARIAGTGITWWVAFVSVAVVLGSGILAFAWKGAVSGPATPVFPASPAIRSTWALVLLAIACLAALVLAIHGRLHHGWLILPILALLVLAAVLAGTASAASPSGPATDGADPPAPSCLL